MATIGNIPTYACPPALYPFLSTLDSLDVGNMTLYGIPSIGSIHQLSFVYLTGLIDHYTPHKYHSTEFLDIGYMSGRPLMHFLVQRQCIFVAFNLTR